VIVAELHLLELAGIGVEGRTGEGGHAKGLDLLGRIAVAGELEVGVGRDRLAGAVADLVGHVDQVTAPIEAHHLGDLHAILLRRLQAQHHAVLAVLEGERARRKLERGLVRRQAVADQAGLGGVLVAGRAVVEQHEIAAGLAARLMLLELEADDVTALRRDFGAQQVGLDHDARRSGRRGGLLTRYHRLTGCDTQRWRRHRAVGRRCSAGGGLLRGHGGLVLLDPALPKHDQREGENQEEDEAALIHRIRSVSGQGTGSYPPGLKG